MQNSCKNIIRALYHDPTSMSTLLKASNNPTNGYKELKTNMSELRDILMAMFLTTPDEESERNVYLRNTAEQERSNAAMIVKLEAEHNAAVADRDDEVC